MKFGHSLIVVAIVAGNLVWLQPASAQTGTETINRLVQIFTTWNGNAKDRSAYAKAARYIDYQGMAQRSISASEWNKLSATQKSDFANSLRSLIEERYYTRWHRIFNKGKLTYKGECNVGADTVVKSDLQLGKKVDALEWRLDTVGGEHRVVSLAVGQSDLLKKLSSRLQGRLDKVGFDGLLTWMTSKANIGPSENYEEASSPTHSQ